MASQPVVLPPIAGATREESASRPAEPAPMNPTPPAAPPAVQRTVSASELAALLHVQRPMSSALPPALRPGPPLGLPPPVRSPQAQKEGSPTPVATPAEPAVEDGPFTLARVGSGSGSGTPPVTPEAQLRRGTRQRLTFILESVPGGTEASLGRRVEEAAPDAAPDGAGAGAGLRRASSLVVMLDGPHPPASAPPSAQRPTLKFQPRDDGGEWSGAEGPGHAPDADSPPSPQPPSQPRTRRPQRTPGDSEEAPLPRRFSSRRSRPPAALGAEGSVPPALAILDAVSNPTSSAASPRNVSPTRRHSVAILAAAAEGTIVSVPSQFFGSSARALSSNSLVAPRDDPSTVAAAPIAEGSRSLPQSEGPSPFGSTYRGFGSFAAFGGSHTNEPGAVVLSRAAVVDVDEEGNDTVNDYTLWQELGRGASGTVYLALDNRALGAMRAIKIIGRRFVERLGDGVLREVAIMKKLRHPHVVTLYECIDDPGADCVYLVMQFVPDGSIARVRQDMTCDTLDPSDVTRFAQQLSGALLYMHRKGVCHGDMKPDNILVDWAGAENKGQPSAYLADFGVGRTLLRGAGTNISNNIARGLSAMSQSTASSRPQGEAPVLPLLTADTAYLVNATPGSLLVSGLPPSPKAQTPKAHTPRSHASALSPTALSRPPSSLPSSSPHPILGSLCGSGTVSSLQGSRVGLGGGGGGGTPLFMAPELLAGGKPSMAADMWALGVTLYALLYGRLPFQAASMDELRQRVANDAVVFPEGSAVPPFWRGILDGLLHKNPAMRLTARRLQMTLRTRRRHSSVGGPGAITVGLAHSRRSSRATRGSLQGFRVVPPTERNSPTPRDSPTASEPDATPLDHGLDFVLERTASSRTGPGSMTDMGLSGGLVLGLAGVGSQPFFAFGQGLADGALSDSDREVDADDGGQEEGGEALDPTAAEIGGAFSKAGVHLVIPGRVRHSIVQHRRGTRLAELLTDLGASQLGDSGIQSGSQATTPQASPHHGSPRHLLGPAAPLSRQHSAGP